MTQSPAHPLHADLERILITPEELSHRIDELAAQITLDYQDQPLLVVGVLKGCLLFLSDLTRRIPFKHAFDTIGASSYGSSTTSSGQVRITKDLDMDVSGKHILIAEDIYDSGHTLRTIIDLLWLHKPASVEICALLWKDKPARAADIPVRYIGFRIPDEFVVGYGLDYQEIYRNLPCIGVLRKEIYSGGRPHSGYRRAVPDSVNV